MIDFTQYLPPDGRKEAVEINRPDDVSEKAEEVISRGGAFEVEMLTNGGISVTCAYEEDDIAIEICANGPDVLAAVDKVVSDAFEFLKGVKL